jgi:hypothetical protein
MEYNKKNISQNSWPLGMCCYNVFKYDITGPLHILPGIRSSVVGSDIMLQAGRSPGRFQMRSMDFSVDLILPAALWLRGQLSL